MVRRRRLAIALLGAAVVIALAAPTRSLAAEFTYSETGELAGISLDTQVFTVNAGTIECAAGTASGEVASTDFTRQRMTVTYGGCAAFGIADVHISPAKYMFLATGAVEVLEPLTINVTIPLLPDCQITVPAQTAEGIAYSNNSGKVVVTAHVSGISYAISGNTLLCGSSGGNGTYTGSGEVWRVGGGSVGFDP